MTGWVRRRLALLLAVPLLLAAGPAWAQKWVTSWAAAMQGPYPSGAPSAQPDLRFAFPDAAAGARDQGFRMVIRPDLWSSRVRLRFSNAFGTKPVTFDAVFLGLHTMGGEVMSRSNRPVLFGGRKQVTVPPGGSAWSDAVTLAYVGNPLAPELAGRRLAVSFRAAGPGGGTGPMTWHAKAMGTSYLTAPGAGAMGELEDESAYPYSTTSWFFLDALDAWAPADTRLVVCFGDSITDGSAATLNGDDRWPDVLSRRLRAAGIRAAVVNAGIAGNQVLGPTEYGPAKPYRGGPSALSRLERDVLGLSGVTDVIWLQGINDLGKRGGPDGDGSGTGDGASWEAVREGFRQGVARLRAKLPGVHVIGATLGSAVGTSSPALSGPEVEAKRQALNKWLRANGGLFDGMADFDAATLDTATGQLRPEFVPGSTVGGEGDKLHPNRAGHLAMGNALDLGLITAPPTGAPRPAPRPVRPASRTPVPAPAEE